MNQDKTFSISEAFKFGFSTYFDNFMLYLKIALASIACFLGAILLGLVYLTVVFEPIPFIASMNPTVLFIFRLAVCASFILSVLALVEIYHYQMLRIGMLLYEKKSVTWKELFYLNFDTFMQYLGARILYNLKVVLGLLLFIVPGFYFAIKGFFIGYAIIDKKALSIREDKEIAYSLSKAIMRKLFFFCLLISPWAYIFKILAVFSVFFTPIVYLIEIHVYKQLLLQEGPAAMQREIASTLK